MATAADKSEVALCNLALNAIGNTRFIVSLDPSADATLEANLCAAAYPQCRDEVLEAIRPPWAQRRSKPAQLDPTTLELGAVPDGWGYAFALPADCLPNGLIAIYPLTRTPQTDEKIPYDVIYDGKLDQVILVCDLPAPVFVWTMRVTNPLLFPPTFSRAVAERLGCDLVRGLRKDAAQLVQQAKVYAGAEATARVAAARATSPDPDPVAFFIADRSG